MAKALKKSEKEVMKLVENKEIPEKCYCYPSNFGDGHQIAFFADEVLKVIKPKTKPKKEKEISAKEKEEDQNEESPPEEKKETPAEKK